MRGRDPGSVAEDHGPLNDPLKLADVPRPVVTAQHFQSVAREADDLAVELGGEPAPEMLREMFHVVAAVSQRRHGQADRANAVKEILAESPLLDERGEILAGGEDQAGLALAEAVPTGAAGRGLHVLKLNLAQELELQPGVQGPDLGDVERPPDGSREL